MNPDDIKFYPQEQYETLVRYGLMKFYQKDWHGVCDAANDIRELLAKYPEIKEDDRA